MPNCQHSLVMGPSVLQKTPFFPYKQLQQFQHVHFWLDMELFGKNWKYQMCYYFFLYRLLWTSMVQRATGLCTLKRKRQPVHLLRKSMECCWMARKCEYMAKLFSFRGLFFWFVYIFVVCSVCSCCIVEVLLWTYHKLNLDARSHA